MPDSPSRLSSALADRYRIERELGQGGMATVYLAQDLKHDRKVAIKVLRAELAAVIGAERFLAEIKTTANLQHPHILPLHDSGEADSFLYYVMPFVEGESLRDRLNRQKQLPIPDAVRIASEVASALDYAHRHRVIHRDIKPENILLHDGRAMVADFGIALAASKAGGTRMTETGMSLGTPHYMSPEQAMGEREIGPPSDVYALGAVTYEMLVGEPPFTGPTAQAIVAKVMTGEPADITGQRRTVPPHVDAAVLTALEKLPADRFESAAEFAEALAGNSSRSTTRLAHSKSASAAGPWRAISAVLGVVVLVLLGLAAWNFSRGRAPSGPSLYDAVLPDSAPMTFAAATATTSYGTSLRNLSISPAGDFAVYAARQGDSTLLWYRSLRDATARPIAGTLGATAPRISPDGARIAFVIGERVMVVPVAGGEVRRLLEGEAATSLQWVSNTELLAVDLDGYRLKQLNREGSSAQTKSIPRCVLAQWVPEQKQLLCSFNRTALLFDPESGKQWSLRAALPDGSPGSLLTGSAFRIVNNRYLVYLAVDGSLLAARYDPATHVALRSVTLLAGVRREAIGEAQYDLSADGTLLYAPGADATIGRMVSLRAGGTPQPLPVETADFQRYDLSRDRRWLAAAVQATEGLELRVYDLRDGQHFTWLKGGSGAPSDLESRMEGGCWWRCAIPHALPSSAAHQARGPGRTRWRAGSSTARIPIRSTCTTIIWRWRRTGPGPPPCASTPVSPIPPSTPCSPAGVSRRCPEREAPAVPDTRGRQDRGHLLPGEWAPLAAGLGRRRAALALGHRGAVPQGSLLVPGPAQSGDRRARRRRDLLGPRSALLRHLGLVQPAVARRRDHLRPGSGRSDGVVLRVIPNWVEQMKAAVDALHERLGGRKSTIIA